MSSSKIRLGQIANVIPGYAFKSGDFKTQGDYPVIKIKNITDDYRVDLSACAYVDASIVNERLGKFLLNKGDILIAMTGATVGKVGKIREDVTAVLNQRVSKIEPVAVESDYLWSILANDSFSRDVYKAADGAAQANISSTQIENIVVPYFEDEIQRKKIGKMFGDLDRKIELNRQMNETLEQIGQALFKKYFVNNPEREGWEEVSVGDIADVTLGGTPDRSSPDYWGGTEIGWINSGEVNKFRITRPTEYITKAGLENSAAKLLPKETTVVAITGATLGQVSRLEKSFATNQSVVGIYSEDKSVNDFLYYWITVNISSVTQHSTGGAQQHINRANVEQVLIKLPPTEILNLVAPSLSSVLALIGKNMFAIDTLKTIRDNTLPELISGRLRI